MTINILISLGVIGLQIASLLLLIGLFTKKSPITGLVSLYKNQIGFFVTLLAIITSFTYSIYFGYQPCLLCWWDRVLMFPQLVIFGVAWMKQKESNLETRILSLLGILVSGYHTFIDFGGNEFISCETGSVSCLQRYVFEFGYITIPVMALSGFVFLFILSFYNNKK